MRKAKCRGTGKEIDQKIKTLGTSPENSRKELHTTYKNTEICNLINEYDGQLDFLSSLSSIQLRNLVSLVVKILLLKSYQINPTKSTQILY